MGTTIAIFVFSTHINEGVSQTWPKKSKKHESARLVDVCYFKFYRNLTLETVSKKTPFFVIWPALEILKTFGFRWNNNLIFKTDEKLRYTVKYDIMKLKLRSLIYVFVCVKYLEEHGKWIELLFLRHHSIRMVK